MCVPACPCAALSGHASPVTSGGRVRPVQPHPARFAVVLPGPGVRPRGRPAGNREDQFLLSVFQSTPVVASERMGL